MWLGGHALALRMLRIRHGSGAKENWNANAGIPIFLRANVSPRNFLTCGFSAMWRADHTHGPDATPVPWREPRKTP